MVTWIALAALAQLISAGIVLVDKYVLVSHAHLGKPVVYAFYISAMSGFVLVLVPFGVISIPSLTVLALAMLASVTFILSVLFLYTALKRGNASDAIPIVGAVSAVVAAPLPSAFLVAIPANRRAIFHGYHASSHGMKWLVVSNKTLGGVAAFLTLLAISIGSVTIVNAMAGLQFVFLLSFAYFGARWFPSVFKGEIHPHQFTHQAYGILCIVAGIAALFLV